MIMDEHIVQKGMLDQYYLELIRHKIKLLEWDIVYIVHT